VSDLPRVGFDLAILRTHASLRGYAPNGAVTPAITTETWMWTLSLDWGERTNRQDDALPSLPVRHRIRISQKGGRAEDFGFGKSRTNVSESKFSVRPSVPCVAAWKRAVSLDWGGENEPPRRCAPSLPVRQRSRIFTEGRKGGRFSGFGKKKNERLRSDSKSKFSVRTSVPCVLPVKNFRIRSRRVRSASDFGVRKKEDERVVEAGRHRSAECVRRCRRFGQHAAQPHTMPGKPDRSVHSLVGAMHTF
jgi:hypothetical protein